VDTRTAITQTIAELCGQVATLQATPDPVEDESTISLRDSVAKLVELTVRTEPLPVDDSPPRDVSIAMARALFARSHLRVTLGHDAHRANLQTSSALLANAFSMEVWELDELREEIDRRVATLMQQRRIARWLEHRFGSNNVDPLFHALFPGVVGARPVAARRLGHRLYVVVEQGPEAPPHTLFMPFSPWHDACRCPPTTSFRPDAVDPGIVRAASQAVGMTMDATREALAEVMAIVPSASAAAYIHRDRWRSTGYAGVTGLGLLNSSVLSAFGPVLDRAVPVEEWGLPNVRREAVLASFDRLAIARVSELLRSHYSSIMAGVLADVPLNSVELVDSFDVTGHIRRVLSPLVRWPLGGGAVDRVVDASDLPRDRAVKLLREIHEIWKQRMEATWVAPPRPERRHSVGSLVLNHLVLVRSSLRKTFAREADSRARHSDVLLSFAGCYFADAPLGRLWRPVGGRVPPPEDVVGDYFWSTWTRVLNALDKQPVEVS